MKTAIWLCACAALLATSLAAASTSERDIKVLHTGTAHRDLYAMAVDPADSNKVVAVGGLGALITSDDGGKTWKDTKLKTEKALLDVAIQGQRTLVVGQTGLILLKDGDGKWQEVKSGTEARLLGVAGNKSGLTFAVGQFGVVLKSEDGGSNWTVLDLKLADRIEGGYDPHLYDVNVSADGVGTIVGEFGLILRSTDAGEHWDIVNTADESLLALQMRDDGTGFAVGQSGIVLRTTDGGEKWSRLDTSLEANLLGVWSTPDGVVTVPGFRHMLVSDDNGATWLQVKDLEVNRGWYIDVRPVGGEPGVIAVGGDGKVIRITRAGS